MNHGFVFFSRNIPTSKETRVRPHRTPRRNDIYGLGLYRIVARYRCAVSLPRQLTVGKTVTILKAFGHRNKTARSISGFSSQMITKRIHAVHCPSVAHCRSRTQPWMAFPMSRQVRQVHRNVGSALRRSEIARMRPWDQTSHCADESSA
jgi:hypothetical protein